MCDTKSDRMDSGVFFGWEVFASDVVRAGVGGRVNLWHSDGTELVTQLTSDEYYLQFPTPRKERKCISFLYLHVVDQDLFDAAQTKLAEVA